MFLPFPWTVVFLGLISQSLLHSSLTSCSYLVCWSYLAVTCLPKNQVMKTRIWQFQETIKHFYKTPSTQISSPPSMLIDTTSQNVIPHVFLDQSQWYSLPSVSTIFFHTHTFFSYIHISFVRLIAYWMHVHKSKL